MRVLLIHPNFDAPLGISIGLSYVAAALRRAGHEVAALHLSELLDYPFDLERIVRDVAAWDPGLVGITCGYNHYPEMQAVCEAVESRLGIPVVMGGIHATLNASAVMAETPSLSFVNVGEGEESIVDLADALERGRDPTGIPNVQARVGGRVYRNAPRPFLDMGTLPDMALDIWDFERVTELHRGWVNVSAQRGCPWRCSYCHNNGEATLFARWRGTGSGNAELGFLRHRPVDAMIAELVALRDRYDVQAFSFIDDTFTMNPKWVTELLARYGDEVRVPFVCNTTAVNLDERLMDALAAAGCRLVRMGVESGSEPLRRALLNRPFPEAALRRAFAGVTARGMHALAFLMIGNVGESVDEMRDTFRFAAALLPTSMKLSLAHPYPGTEYDDVAREKDAVDPSRRTHNFIEDSVLRRPPAERLWLDKARTFYFWYVNRYLGNGGVRLWKALVRDLEALPADRWADPDVRARLWRRHEDLSSDLAGKGVLHYTAPFPDRPDITVSGLVVAEGRQLYRRELGEPH